MRQGEAVTFLVVDDDEVAVMGMRRAIAKLGLANPIEVARNGEEALALLKSRGRDIAPYLVTLDLNMPRMGGLQFLEEVRRDASLRRAVIFVVTTSDAPADILGAYARNVAGYILKDNAFETLRRALELLNSYSGTVTFPLLRGHA